jgi:hypothetical protein
MSIYLLLPNKELQNKITHYTSTANLHVMRRADASSTSSSKNAIKTLRKSSGGADVEMREMKRSAKNENGDATTTTTTGGGEKMAGKGKRKDESSGSDTRERLNTSGGAGSGNSDPDETRKKAKREGGMKSSAVAPATLANSYMLTTTMAMDAVEHSYIGTGTGGRDCDRDDALHGSQCSSVGSQRGGCKPRSLKDEMNRFVKDHHHHHHHGAKHSRRESDAGHTTTATSSGRMDEPRSSESFYGAFNASNSRESVHVTTVEEDKSKAKACVRTDRCVRACACACAVFPNAYTLPLFVNRNCGRRRESTTGRDRSAMRTLRCSFSRRPPISVPSVRFHSTSPQHHHHNLTRLLFFSLS